MLLVEIGHTDWHDVIQTVLSMFPKRFIVLRNVLAMMYGLDFLLVVSVGSSVFDISCCVVLNLSCHAISVSVP